MPAGRGFTLQRVAWGKVGDLPVTGDWNGDKVTDIGVRNPSLATFYMRQPGATPGTYRSVARAFGTRR